MTDEHEHGEQGTLFEVSVTSTPPEESEEAPQLVEDVAVAETVARSENELIDRHLHEEEIRAILEQDVADKNIAPEEVDGIAQQMAYDAVKETP